MYILAEKPAKGGLDCYGTLLTATFDDAPTTVLPRQNLAGTIMVLAGCWPKKALGEPELAY